MTFDLCWFAVNEVLEDGEARGEGLNVECLAVLRKSDLSAELRNLEHGRRFGVVLRVCACSHKAVLCILY